MKPIIVIKTGGKVAVTSTELTSLIEEIKVLKQDYDFVLVHGGGAEVTETSKVYGLEAQFIDGVRMTTAKEMNIVDGVLAGRVNKRLVRNFESLGVKSVGLSGNDGQIFIGRSIDPNVGNKTGVITKTNPELLLTLLSSGFTPVISSVSMDTKGSSLNINADEAALAVSSSLTADKVIFISDIPGILKESKVIKNMTPSSINNEIENKVISGGMIPKVKSSIKALESGVASVVISNYTESKDLMKLINNSKGTIITLDKERV